MGIAKDPKEFTLGKIYPRRPVRFWRIKDKGGDFIGLSITFILGKEEKWKKLERYICRNFMFGRKEKCERF